MASKIIQLFVISVNFKTILFTYFLNYLITAGGLLSLPQPGPDWSLVGRLSLQDSTGKDPHHATRGSH